MTVNCPYVYDGIYNFEGFTANTEASVDFSVNSPSTRLLLYSCICAEDVVLIQTLLNTSFSSSIIKTQWFSSYKKKSSGKFT